jgi:putative transposase
MIHDRKPNRLRGYDYSKDNLYFITPCVQHRVCCLGEIVNVGTGRDLSNIENNAPSLSQHRDPSVRKQMILNEYGQIAEKQWHWLSEQYPYVVLHAFVVMPNHIHGIIEINRSTAAGTGRDLSLPIKIKSLSELIGAYKTTVSKQIHLLGYANFAWQRSFHDHIIRDDQSYNNISDYILNNPQKWEEDKFFNL